MLLKAFSQKRDTYCRCKNHSWTNARRLRKLRTLGGQDLARLGEDQPAGAMGTPVCRSCAAAWQQRLAEAERLAIPVRVLPEVGGVVTVAKFWSPALGSTSIQIELT